jgi:hypothetical protein
MVNPLRRWFHGSHGIEHWTVVVDWAESKGHRFARSRDGDGFVIESNRVGQAWRLEWGPPQRHYFSGPELRLRAEVGASGDLQMLVMTRGLMTLLEQQAFEESIEGTETRMDDDLPEEMRWLVLHPKVPRSELGALRDRFGALSNFPRAALSWLDKPIVDQLDASVAWQPANQPLALVMQRGRLTLRCAAPQPAVPALEGALALFVVALASARRVATELLQGKIKRERPSTWGPPSAMPAADESAR